MKQRVVALVGVLTLGLVAILALVDATRAAADATAVPPNIDIIKSFNIGMPPTLNDTKEFITGESLEMQLTVTNNEASNINLLVFDAMSPEDAAACQPDFNRLQVQSAGAPTAAIDVSALGESTDAYAGAMALELPPGESWVGRIAFPVRSAAPGCELVGAPIVYAEIADPIDGSCEAGRSPQCQYEGWSPSAEDVLTLIQMLDPVEGNIATATFITPDLGDAPDSTNHFGAAMTAYPTVQADFPTVFDPATGAPSGPLHMHARPLRLGELASRERDADLNPNRNLNPNTNTANLDTRDDGLDLSLVSFNNCAVSTIPVEITVEQWAVDYFAENDSVAYLNLWVDGNRDGDWADGQSCGNATAVEHIIINEAVDVAALGAGIHTINVTTELVPWPANLSERPSWLRVSLSDAKAPTPLSMGGIGYGDGRGPAGRYFLGETEDYRWRSANTPPNQLEGADLAVRVDGRLDVRDIPPIEIQLNATQMLTHTTAVFLETITLMNRGDSPALGTQLIIMPDPALRNNNVEFEITSDPPLPPDIMKTTCHGSDADCRILIDLGDVQPSAEPISIAVSGEVLCDPMSSGLCTAEDVSARAMVISDNDVNPQNDSDEKTWELPRPVDSLLPPSITTPGNGTTNENQVQVGGLARPMALVEIYLNGWEEGVAAFQVQADGMGRWQATLNLEPGPHEIIAAYPDSKDHSKPMNLIVRPNLPFDPLGIVIEHQDLSFQPWGRNGRVDAQGWSIPMTSDASATYRMSVPFGCNNDNAAVNLLQPGTNIAAFSDPNNDGIFTAEFKTGDLDPDELVGLRFTCGNQQLNVAGEARTRAIEADIRDAQTNQPIEGAAVVLWESYTATDDLWKFRRDPSVNDQFNPRFTDSSGGALFFPSNGVYAFEVIADGYQSFKTPPILASRCLTCIDARLMPLQTVGTPMALTGDGFNPPALTIEVGDTLEWANVDVNGRGIEVSTSTANGLLDAQNTPLFASGVLQAGDRFSATFDEPGTYTLIDPLDPQMRAAVIVEPPGPDGNQLFLPAVLAK